MNLELAIARESVAITCVWQTLKGKQRDGKASGTLIRGPWHGAAVGGDLEAGILRDS